MNVRTSRQTPIRPHSSCGLACTAVVTAVVIVATMLIGAFATSAAAQESEWPPHDGGTSVEYSQVIGGTPAPADAYPFTVFIEHDSGTLAWCAGSLIAPTVVLTAAHCIYRFPISQARIWVGADNLLTDFGDEIEVIGFIAHPDYEEFSTNDLAVIILAEPSPVEPIRLASAAHANLGVAGQPLVAVGWGIQDVADTVIVNDLTEVVVPVVDDAICASELAATGAGVAVVPATMICAGGDGVDTCKWDSGGPLFGRDGAGRYVQLGITSWGDGCAVTPGVYTEVAAFSDWLSQFVVADGDVNISGELEAGDALAVLQSITQSDPGTYDEPQGDLSGDGATDLLDALLLAQELP